MDSRARDNIIIGFLCVGTVLLLFHSINWLVVKGLIWGMYELFNVNWYNKFWVVYVFVIVFGAITGGIFKTNK